MVVIGTPDSWDPSITSISTEGSKYLSSIWSPCSQFVAAVTGDALEIRDASTLKLLSTIQSIKVATRFRPGLAYSPDGCSLAGCSNIGIVIWDTQTGGVVRRIECEVTGDELELVWSLDGMTIGTISPWGSAVCPVHTYEVASGAIQSSGALQSLDPGQLWAHEGSFRVMTTAEDYRGSMINIFEVGSALTRVEQFPIQSYSSLGVFSPTTYRISVLIDNVLFVLDVRSSDVLLQETGRHLRHSFSPDGTFFAALRSGYFFIWRYTSGNYTRWREFRQTSAALQFSPTLSSVLSSNHARLHIFHLDSPASLAMESVVKTHGRLQETFSPDGTYIVTAHQGESIVAITNLDSRRPSPSQFIDTNLKIKAVALTGNVLLVGGQGTVVAWLLTEKGAVDGVSGNTVAGRKDSLWINALPGPTLQGSPVGTPQSWAGRYYHDDDLVFSVEGETATVILNRSEVRVYHTRTGDILGGLDQAPRSRIGHFNYVFPDQCERYHRDLFERRGRLEYDWPVSKTTLRGGWVKDPEGKHRSWLHTRWRSPQTIDWLQNATTLQLKISSELIIIKF